MNTFLIFIVVGVVGIALGVYFGRGGVKVREGRVDKKNKKRNLERVRGLFDRQEKVTNSDVEHVLGVSDATATRYLDELEKEGLIRQVGEAGRHVHYEKL